MKRMEQVDVEQPKSILKKTSSYGKENMEPQGVNRGTVPSPNKDVSTDGNTQPGAPAAEPRAPLRALQPTATHTPEYTAPTGYGLMNCPQRSASSNPLEGKPPIQRKFFANTKKLSIDTGYTPVDDNIHDTSMTVEPTDDDQIEYQQREAAELRNQLVALQAEGDVEELQLRELEYKLVKLDRRLAHMRRGRGGRGGLQHRLYNTERQLAAIFGELQMCRSHYRSVMEQPTTPESEPETPSPQYPSPYGAQPFPQFSQYTPSYSHRYDHSSLPPRPRQRPRSVSPSPRGYSPQHLEEPVQTARRSRSAPLELRSPYQLLGEELRIGTGDTPRRRSPSPCFSDTSSNMFSPCAKRLSPGRHAFSERGTTHPRISDTLMRTNICVVPFRRERSLSPHPPHSEVNPNSYTQLSPNFHLPPAPPQPPCTQLQLQPELPPCLPMQQHNPQFNGYLQPTAVYPTQFALQPTQPVPCQGPTPSLVPQALPIQIPLQTNPSLFPPQPPTQIACQHYVQPGRSPSPFVPQALPPSVQMPPSTAIAFHPTVQSGIRSDSPAVTIPPLDLASLSKVPHKVTPILQLSKEVVTESSSSSFRSIPQPHSSRQQAVYKHVGSNSETQQPGQFKQIPQQEQSSSLAEAQKTPRQVGFTLPGDSQSPNTSRNETPGRQVLSCVDPADSPRLSHREMGSGKSGYRSSSCEVRLPIASTDTIEVAGTEGKRPRKRSSSNSRLDKRAAKKDDTEALERGWSLQTRQPRVETHSAVDSEASTVSRGRNKWTSATTESKANGGSIQTRSESFSRRHPAHITDMDDEEVAKLTRAAAEALGANFPPAPLTDAWTNTPRLGRTSSLSSEASSWVSFSPPNRSNTAISSSRKGPSKKPHGWRWAYKY